MNKNEYLKEIMKILEQPYIKKWYAENLESTPQTETIDKLMKGVHETEISIIEALTLALIIGI